MRICALALAGATLWGAPGPAPAPEVTMPEVVYLWGDNGALLARRNPKGKAYPFKDGIRLGYPPPGVSAERWYRYDLVTVQAAHLYGVDPAFLKALLWVESSNRPDAMSSAGAMGRAQLMPATARRLGVKNPFDPHEATYGSAAYLRRTSDQFQTQNMLILVASYNAGDEAVARTMRRINPRNKNPWAVVPVPPFTKTMETLEECRSVLNLFDRIHRGLR